MIANTTQPNGEKKNCFSSFLSNVCKVRIVRSAEHLVGEWGGDSKCKSCKGRENFE